MQPHKGCRGSRVGATLRQVQIVGNIRGIPVVDFPFAAGLIITSGGILVAVSLAIEVRDRRFRL